MKRVLITLFVLFAHLVYAQDWRGALDNFDYRGAIRLLDYEITAKMEQAPVDSAFVRHLAIQKAKCQKQIMDFDGAYETLAMVYGWQEPDMVVLGEMAECVRLMGNTAEALTLYGLLHKMFPGNLYFSLQHMSLQYAVGLYKESLDSGKKLLASDTMPVVLNCVGNSFNKLKQKDSALVYYGKLYEMVPYDYKVLEKISAIMLDKEMYDSVSVMCSNFLQMDSLNIPINGVYGLALHYKGDYERSREVFETYLDAGGDSLTAFYYLGMNYLKEKNFYVAATNFGKAMKLDSTDVDLIYYTAYSTAETWRRDEALDMYAKAEQLLQPDSIMVYKISYGKAEAYLKCGRHKDAEASYLKAIRYGAKEVSGMIYCRLGYCYRLAGKFEKSLQAYETYLKHWGEEENSTKKFVLNEIEYVKEELFMKESAK